MGDHFFLWKSKREIMQLLEQESSIDGKRIAEICKKSRGDGWYRRLISLQIEEEFVDLINWAKKFSPDVTIEIGTYQGGTLLGWAKVTKEILISIDLLDGYPPQKQKLYKILNYPEQTPEIITIQQSSQEVSTFKSVQKILGKKQVDLLYIDGDHRYEGVKRDFELWSPLVKSGGVVVFHDIIENQGSNYGVHLLWSELKPHFQVEEIISEPSQNGYGIGILYIH